MIGELWQGVLGILIATLTVLAGYFIAFVRQKALGEKRKNFQELAKEAVMEVEEISRAQAKSYDGKKMTSQEKEDLGVEKLNEKAKAFGVKIPNAISSATSAIKTAVSIVRMVR